MRDWESSGGASGIWHPFTADPFTGPKTTFVRASGAYLWDVEGRRYFDGTSSWWCQIHGHCHPRLVQALSAQAATLDQILLAPHDHPKAIELSQELLAALGAPFQKIFFSDDGSTAVEAAIKMALQYWHNAGRPEKRKLVSVDRAYHGDTLGAVAIGGVSQYHAIFQSGGVEVARLPAPYCYRCPVGKSFPSCELACLQPAFELLKAQGDEIAALIVEPMVLGAGGFITYPREWLQSLVALAQASGVLVIFDEVFTGFGRTGPMFAFEHIAARPDIVCLSKGLTSGMLPLAVTAATEKVYAEFRGGGDRTFFHGHTFTGNGLGCAVALESLRLFSDMGVLTSNFRLQRIFAEAVERFSDLEHVGEVRHLGMIFALELVQDKHSKRSPDPANGPGWRLCQALWEEGIYLRPLNNIVYLVPPYCSEPEELQAVLSVLYSHLKLGKYWGEANG